MDRFGQDVCFSRAGQLFRLRAAAVILHENRVLMAGNNACSYLYSVGGAVHLGESIEDALMREVTEETGQKLNIVRLLAIHQNFFKDSDMGNEAWHELAFYYLMDGWSETVDKPRSLNMTGHEEQLTWVPLRTFGSFHAFPVFFSELETMLDEKAPRLIISRE